MKLNIITGKLTKIETEAIVLFVHENEKLFDDLNIIDKKLNGIISGVFKKGYFSGKEGQIYPIHTYGNISAEKVVLVGLGKKEKFNQEKLRIAVAKTVKFLRDSSIKNVTIVLLEKTEGILEDLATMSQISLYEFKYHKTKDKSQKEIQRLNFYLFDIKNLKSYQSVLKKSLSIADSINWTRDIINHPSNFITPKQLTVIAKKLSSENLNVKAFGEKELKKMGMGLILGVSKGSDEEAQLIQLDYKPKNYKETLVLVGKGMTFDSGGISLKPSKSMNEMKMDMAGAGVVLGIMKLLKEIKPKIRVIGLVPAAENMPSGKAIKPSDILISASGQTVEIDDTDAEGRLILADALFYAQSFKPTAIIDLATLTGATLIALGSEASSLLGNNQKLVEKIKISAGKSGEKVWQLPLWDEYRELIKSDVADINNTGKTRDAGVITAAAFLENFVGNYPWAHLDIAGTAMTDKPKAYNQKGATGYGIRLIADLIENWSI